MEPAPRVPGARSAPQPAGRDTGAAALEFALVSPLLFALIFMILGAGWGLWEYQAARATAREAARLASVGIPDLAAYGNNVVCLGEHNGLRPGRLTGLDVRFHDTATAADLDDTTQRAVLGGYVSVRLSYHSALDGLTFLPWTFVDENGGISAEAVTRVEQLGAVTGGGTVGVDGQDCS